jgi:hypothetical protein
MLARRVAGHPRLNCAHAHAWFFLGCLENELVKLSFFEHDPPTFAEYLPSPAGGSGISLFFRPRISFFPVRFIPGRKILRFELDFIGVKFRDFGLFPGSG